MASKLNAGTRPGKVAIFHATEIPSKVRPFPNSADKPSNFNIVDVKQSFCDHAREADHCCLRTRLCLSDVSDHIFADRT